MNPTKIRCPHCGSSILVKQSGKTNCRVCGTVLYVEEEEKSVQINVIGHESYGRRMSPELFVISMVLCAVASIFFILLPMLTRRPRKAEPKAKVHYATTLTDPVLVSAFTDVFEKEPAAWTADDYARVKEISFQRERDKMFWLRVKFTDDSERQVPILHDRSSIVLDGSAFQVFPNLEGLRAASGNTGDAIRISFDSEEYAHTLGNLKKLKALYLSDFGGYDNRPENLANLVADPGAIEELGGVTLMKAEDADHLVERFPNLKKLLIGRREEMISLSDLQKLSKLEELGTELDVKSNEDLIGLSQVRSMQLSARASGKEVKDLQFLSSLTQLDSLTLMNIDKMKNLNVLTPLTQLKELKLFDGRELRSIAPLASLTELRILDIGSCYGIEDLRALSSLTKLQTLHVANPTWHFSAELPDLSGLTALEELTAEVDSMPQFADCHSLKKLTIEADDIKDKDDFSLLTGLGNLEMLRLNFGSIYRDLPNIDSLSALPALKTVTIAGRMGPVSLRAFPHATDITVIMDDMASAPLRFESEIDSDNTSLERLRIFGFDGVELGKYNSTVAGSAALMQLAHCKALRELRLNHCALTDLDFVSGLPNLEVLDVSGNRIEDVSPLTGLPRLRMLFCGDNTIRNIAVLQGRGLVLSE